jgi:hypothetical protein
MYLIRTIRYSIAHLRWEREFQRWNAQQPEKFAKADPAVRPQMHKSKDLAFDEWLKAEPKRINFGLEI